MDGEHRQVMGGGIVDVAAVGLELERDTRVGEKLEDLPAMRHSERLASAESNIRDAESNDVPGEFQRLVSREFVAPSLVGTGLLAAGDTVRAAAVSQLPGNKKRRAVLVDRVPLHSGMLR